MSRAIVRAVVVAILLLAFGTEAAIAAPARAVKASDAASCCAGRCARLQAVACENGCCPSTRANDAPILSPAPTSQPMSIAAAAVSAAPPLGVAVAASAPSAIAPAAALGPPLPPPLHAPLRL